MKQSDQSQIHPETTIRAQPQTDVQCNNVVTRGRELGTRNVVNRS